MTASDPSMLAGRYLLGEMIGRGGMADVRRGTDQVLKRDVAIKVLRSTTNDPSAQSRFAAEARTVAALNHPGIVTILDAGVDGDLRFLVMELVEGPTLAGRLSQSGPLDSATVAAMGADIAAALAYAHQREVVHRDVKPGNILIRADGTPVLTDFGIARLLTDTGGHTQDGQTIGSPAYLSPEQVNGSPTTPAVDVYALGLVLLEALTATRAYPGPAIEAAIARLSNPPAIPVSAHPELRDLLVDMTALDPAARPDAAQVASILGAVAAHAATSEGTHDEIPVQVDQAGETAVLLDFAGSTAAARTRSRGRRGVLGAVAAAAVLALTATGISLLGDTTPGSAESLPTDSTPAPTTTPTNSDNAPIASSPSASAPATVAVQKEIKPAKAAAKGRNKAPKPKKGKGHARK